MSGTQPTASTAAKATRAHEIKLFGNKARNSQLEAKRDQAAAVMAEATEAQNVRIHSDDGSTEQERSDDLMQRAQVMASSGPVFREGTQAVPSAVCPPAETTETIE